GNALHRAGIIEVVDEIEDELFAITAANEIHFRALLLYQGSIKAGEDAAESEFDLGVCRADFAGKNLGVRITSRAEETEADEGRLAALDFFDYEFVGRVGIGLVEHHAF